MKGSSPSVPITQMSKARLGEGGDPPQGMQGTQLAMAESGFEPGRLWGLCFRLRTKGMG